MLKESFNPMMNLHTTPNPTLSRLTLLFCTIILFVGCEEGGTGTIDTVSISPQVSDALVSPDTVNVDTLSASGGTYTIKATGRVKASDADGDLSAVLLRIIGRDSATPFSETALHDDGVAPDSAAGDGLYAGSFEFELTRAEAGPYRIQIVASDSRGLESSALERTLYATRANSPPTLDAQSLVAPDTVDRPPSGSSLYFMSIAATDSDGLADVREVYFRNLNSPSQAKQFLFDDGGVVGPNGINSGDLFAGDGIFSIIFQVPFDVPTGLYQFAFQAADSFGDTSGTLIHNVVVQ